MFDIKEYFDNEYKLRDSQDIVNLDLDITHDINDLLSNRFDNKYQRDRYKHSESILEIIYPTLLYPGNNSLILNPDRIRYLLSFYPYKNDFYNVEKIVIRPRFIEIGNIELVSLYLRRKKILVLYLYHPHFYPMKSPGLIEDVEAILHSKLTDDTVRQDDCADIHIHPLWYFISIIKTDETDTIDKFFIKKDSLNDKIYEVLTDISFYYSRNGY